MGLFLVIIGHIMGYNFFRDQYSKSNKFFVSVFTLRILLIQSSEIFLKFFKNYNFKSNSDDEFEFVVVKFIRIDTHQGIGQIDTF